jgi:Rieske Fe-S protein
LNTSRRGETLIRELISRKKFMRLTTMLGLSSVTASILAACGGSSGGGQTTQASGGEQSTTQASGSSVSKGETIASISEVPANSAKGFTDTDTGQPAVLVHLQNGNFAAFSAVCTHEGCTVSYQPDSQKLVCPCHGSIFDPAQGAAVNQGPARTALPQIAVAQQGGEVVLT